jgi:tetratricopeptide (TPR) repeat protein
MLPRHSAKGVAGMSWELVKLVAVLTGILLSAISVSSASWIWVRKQIFGYGGSALCSFGVILIGLSIWSNVQLSVSPSQGVDLKLSELEKAIASLTRTSDEMRAVNETASAVDAYKKALALGENPEVATTLVNLGHVYDQQGNLPAAADAYEKALALGEKTLGPKNPEVATTLVNLGHVYDQQGNLPAAADAYNKALALWEETLGPNHPEVAVTLLNLARISSAQGDMTIAESLLKRALSIEQSTGRLSLPPAIEVRLRLADLYRAEGRLDAAEQMLRDALALLDRTKATQP